MTKTILLSHFYNYKGLIKNINTVNTFTFLKVKTTLNDYLFFILCDMFEPLLNEEYSFIEKNRTKTFLF